MILYRFNSFNQVIEKKKPNFSLFFPFVEMLSINALPLFLY